jgi:hypothetical protein
MINIFPNNLVVIGKVWHHGRFVHVVSRVEDLRVPVGHADPRYHRERLARGLELSLSFHFEAVDAVDRVEDHVGADGHNEFAPEWTAALDPGAVERDNVVQADSVELSRLCLLSSEKAKGATCV